MAAVHVGVHFFQRRSAKMRRTSEASGCAALKLKQHGCQSQSWMGCSYPQPIRELFINAAANQADSWFAHSNLDFIAATYGASSVHYVWHVLPLIPLLM